MSNQNQVGQRSLKSFGYALLASIESTQLNTAGNAVIVLPMLGGGLTVGNSVVSSGIVIIRRISLVNPSGALSTANVSITTSNDGNASNAVVAATALIGLTGAGTFEDLTIVGGNVVVNGYTTQALYVNVGTASGNNNTVSIRVYGDVVNF